MPGRHAQPLLRYFAATRPAFLSVTLVACLIGLATAGGSGVRLNAAHAALALLLALITHAGANVINDYHDAISGADAANTQRIPPFTGGSRFIQDGVLTPRQTAVFGHALLVGVIPAGLWLTWQAGPGLLALGGAGLFLAWAYSARPLALMGRGLGEAVIATAWLLVVIATDYVQRGSFSALPAVAGLPYALLVANLLFINQFPDRRGDAVAGKRTLVVRLGPEAAKWGYPLIAGLAYGWLLLAVTRELLPPHAAAAALTLPLSLGAARALIRDAGHPARLAAPIRHTILAANAHGLLLAGAIVLAGW